MNDKKLKYKVSPVLKHVKQCIHETMTVGADNKTVTYNKYLFTPENFKCGGCNSSEDVVFMRVPPINVVVRSCTFCGVTQPVDIKDDRGNMLAEDEVFANETHIMSIPEVAEFVERNKIDKKFLPTTIRNMLKSKRQRRRVNIDELGLETE